MKHKRIVISLAVALVAALALVGLARIAPVQAQAVKQAVVQVVTTVTDSVLPAPTPTPTPSFGGATQPAPPVNPPAPPVTTPEPTSFPHLVPSPTAAPANPQPEPSGAPPSPAGEPPAPQTEVFVSASPCTGPNFDVNTGGCKGPAPFTVTFTAELQLGVAGVTPTYQWSNGMTGRTITVEYTNPGTYTAPDVTVTQVVNGVTYQINSTTHTRITITVS